MLSRIFLQKIIRKAQNLERLFMKFWKKQILFLPENLRIIKLQQKIFRLQI